MKNYHRLHGIFVGVGMSALFIALSIVWSLHLPTNSARAAQLQATKPVSGWSVCGDLGIGSVPGLPDLRQRLRLCHAEGWTINTYCTQPGWPAPPIGRSCTRIGEEKYQCGANYQLLREYRILATPVSTPAPNATPTYTSTPPGSVATRTPPPRPPTGGQGNAAQVRTLIFTEIGIFSLALGMGIWFFRRLEKFG